jgi:hypothetical protein
MTWAKDESQTVEVHEGTARLDYSKTSDCICCDGPHVHASSIEGFDGGGTGLLSTFANQRKAWIDGRLVRITIEVLDEVEGGAQEDGR